MSILLFLFPVRRAIWGDENDKYYDYYELPDLALFQIKAAVTAIKDQMDRTFCMLNSEDNKCVEGNLRR